MSAKTMMCDVVSNNDAIVSLHPVQPSDARFILSLASAFHAEDGHPLHPASAAAVDEFCRGDPSAPAWLIVVDGEVQGYVSLALSYRLEFGGRDAFIDDFFIRSPMRCRGIGRHVLTLVETEARARGVRMLRLEVERTNDRARSLYARCGFEDVQRRLMGKAL